MSHRSSRWINLSAVFLLAGCASVGTQPPAYVEDPKPKAQAPCQAPAQGSQGTTAKDPCKKTQ